MNFEVLKQLIDEAVSYQSEITPDMSKEELKELGAMIHNSLADLQDLCKKAKVELRKRYKFTEAFAKSLNQEDESDEKEEVPDVKEREDNLDA